MNLATFRMPRHRLGAAGSAIVALGAPAAVSLLAVGEGHPSTTSVALLFVVGVVVSSSFGGYLAGFATAVLSFLSLNFFFTPPLHTFAVASATDLVALVAFLAVSVGVGALLSASIKERDRAERRELELRMMNRLMTSLVAGESPSSVLGRHGDDINAMLGSVRCVISTASGEEIQIGDPTLPTSEQPFELDLRAKDRLVGRMSVWPPRGSRPSSLELQVIEPFGKQLALALEGVRLSEQVRRAEMEAEAHRLKASLFSGVTHDVKTPLAAITASVTSLLDGRGFTPDQSREHLEMIKQEAERLHRVVNNLLDLARLRAGALYPTKEPAAVDEVIESVVARMRPQLDGREVVVRVRDDIPEVGMDVVQIDQVLTNLIENAVKFSPPNGELVVSAVGDPDKVRVTVADAGPGIPKGEEELIFEPFQKGSPDVPGTGLGLAIARAIVTAHGGRIWVTRPPRGGAAFTFELPCDISRTEEVGRGQPAHSGR